MFRPLIAGPSAAPSHLVFPAGQPGQGFAGPLPGLRRGRLCTAALLPQAQIASGLPRFHEGRLSLAQPQMASSALKSGLYPGRACPRENGGSPASTPAQAS